MAELFKVNAPVRKPLFEGVQGENEARSIQFDIEPWVTELGDGAVTATAKRSQDSQPYPVTVTKDGNIVTWKPTSTDTAYAGAGSFQLEYTVDSVLAKTCIWSTMVAPSLDPAGDPPDPYDNWLAEMRQIAADALQSEQNAEASVEDAEAWAVGQRGGVDVPSTDPTYENNAKYWAEQSLANQYGAFIVKSASGDIASFTDGADGVQMKSLNVTITPKQAGSGDPSPSNVRAISGTSTANVFVTGVNLLNPSAVNVGKYWSDGGVLTSLDGQYCSEKIGAMAGESYYFSAFAASLTVKWFTESMTLILKQDLFSTTPNRTLTAPAGVKYLCINASTDMRIDFYVNYPSTDTAYHPYTGHTTPVPLGQTVYGGEVNPISGELTISKVMVDLGALTWGYDSGQQIFYTTSALNNAKRPSSAGEVMDIMCSIYKPISYYSATTGAQDKAVAIAAAGACWVNNHDYTSASAFKTAMNGIPFVYPLATPITIQLTPTQVASLLGTNNVWSDAGDVAVEYRADPTLAYAELQALILENL